MGTANLIPGVSGGTMILALGVYEEFIGAVADVTALRFTRRSLFFLGLLGFSAAAAVLGLSSLILYLLFAFPAVMFALFIGLTLGGTPTLLRMIGRPRGSVIIAVAAGLAVMVGVALFRTGTPLPRNTPMDLISGLVGSTTMVLPGISGSYMLLVLNQYDRVLGAVDDLRQGSLAALQIIVPVGVGVIAGIVGLSHLLKLLLIRYEKVTLGFLLGMLWGAVLGLWPFNRPPTEKILAKRSEAQLQVHADQIGLQGTSGLRKEALVEHILLAWDLQARPPERVGRMYKDTTLRAFASAEEIPQGGVSSGTAMARHLAQHGPSRMMEGPAWGNVMAATAAAIAGFIATMLLGNMGRARERAP
jgi:putative membrane protein